jgi:hypothetical protein
VSSDALPGQRVKRSFNLAWRASAGAVSSNLAGPAAPGALEHSRKLGSATRISVTEVHNPKSGSELQHATPNNLPYVNNRIVSHDVQVVVQIYRRIAVWRYECDNAAKRQAISRSWKGETTVLISEK